MLKRGCRGQKSSGTNPQKGGGITDNWVLPEEAGDGDSLLDRHMWRKEVKTIVLSNAVVGGRSPFLLRDG